MTRAERAVLLLLCIFAVKFVCSTVAHFVPALQGIDMLGSGRHPVDVWLLLLSCTAVLGTWCLYRRAAKALDARLAKFDAVVLAICIAASAAFYLHAMVGRQSLYLWDNATYYNLQIRLESNFADGVFTGVGSTIYKTWFNDYAPLVINLLAEPFFMFTPRTANTFALLCGLLVPTLVYYSAWVLLAVLRRQCRPKAPRLFTALGLAMTTLLPLLHIALYRGMPDLLGVAFALMLLALGIGYDFSAPAPARLVSMAAFTGLLMLTRRSYMFTVAAFFVLYSVWVLVRAALQKQGKAALHFAKFAITSLICVGVPLVPMFWRIVKADYSARYATYQTGGFLAELDHQRVYLGYFIGILFVIGILYALYKKQTRFLTVLSAVGSVLTVFLVTKVQNMDDHQSLAVAPFYLLGLYMLALLTANLPGKWLRRALAALVSVGCAINFAGCSQLMPIKLPGAWYSGLFFTIDNERTDMAQIAEVNDFLRENCEGDNSAYMICHGLTYSADVFRAAALPDESIRSILAYGAVNPGNDAFPKELFTAQMGNGYTITAYRRVKAPAVAELDAYRRWLAEEDEQFPYNFSAVWDQLETELANNG